MEIDFRRAKQLNVTFLYDRRMWPVKCLHIKRNIYIENSLACNWIKLDAQFPTCILYTQHNVCNRKLSFIDKFRVFFLPVISLLAKTSSLSFSRISLFVRSIAMTDVANFSIFIAPKKCSQIFKWACACVETNENKFFHAITIWFGCAKFRQQIDFYEYRPSICISCEQEIMIVC